MLTRFMRLVTLRVLVNRGHTQMARNGSKWIRPARRLAIYVRDGFQCLYCGANAGLTLDHIVPLHEGGHNGDDNLVTACLSCNSSRGASSVAEFTGSARAHLIIGHAARPMPHLAFCKRLASTTTSIEKLVTMWRGNAVLSGD